MTDPTTGALSLGAMLDDRDALAARLREYEEALRKLTHEPKFRTEEATLYAMEVAQIARAALAASSKDPEGSPGGEGE